MSTEVRPAFGQMRVPDILETIADLSNDEVFTPPDLANKVLDMLPESIWTDSSVTFLDPATKTGVFLREITKRLIAGLEHEFPDLQERVNHILTKQVYGLGITELTSLMSRRTVYCSTTANGIKSVCTEFDDIDGNIKFPDSKHSFNKHGKCTVCGAGEDLYYEEEGLDNYAYSFLHDNLKEVFGDVKFDVIIGNPPYQLETGGGFAQAKPIYNLFVQKAIELRPKYISMIIPSRWMKGGMGLKDFREKIIDSEKIEEIHDFQSSHECFEEVSIDGGVCYFLFNENHKGETKYFYKDSKGEIIYSKRKLKNEITDTIIRDYRQIGIIEKSFSLKEKSFSTIVGNNYGFKTNLFNNPQEYKNMEFSESPKEGYSLIHGVLGVGGTKRVSKYIKNSYIDKNFEDVSKYKLFFGKAFNSAITAHPPTIKGNPGSLCTDTFLSIGPFNKESEMLNCDSYMRTKFFRALYHYNRSSFIGSKNTFSLIPLQDFSKSWTDEELYKKYKLTEEEIAYIEENIEAME